MLNTFLCVADKVGIDTGIKNLLIENLKHFATDLLDLQLLFCKVCIAVIMLYGLFVLP